MKNKVATVLWILCVGVAFVAGALTMRVWDKKHPKNGAEEPSWSGAALLTMDEQDFSLPKDVQDAQPTLEISDAQEVPSQLVKINLPELVSVNRVEEEEPAENLPLQPRAVAPISLENVQGTVTPQESVRVVVTPDGEGNTTMIQVPAEVKLINNLEEYKEFKRVARGKYPTVDFKTQRVAVLQTKGDLPDNALEVADVTEEGDSVQITYRVNVFGLDKKTNTHAFALLPKTPKQVVLKQVL